MSVQIRPKDSPQPSTTDSQKPLRRVQEYLVELRVCISLLKEVIIEFKELIVIVALLAYFIWGAINEFKRTH
jgi:hypothetical protein